MDCKREDTAAPVGFDLNFEVVENEDWKLEFPDVDSAAGEVEESEGGGVDPLAGEVEESEGCCDEGFNCKGELIDDEDGYDSESSTAEADRATWSWYQQTKNIYLQRTEELAELQSKQGVRLRSDSVKIDQLDRWFKRYDLERRRVVCRTLERRRRFFSESNLYLSTLENAEREGKDNDSAHAEAGAACRNWRSSQGPGPGSPLSTWDLRLPRKRPLRRIRRARPQATLGTIRRRGPTPGPAS